MPHPRGADIRTAGLGAPPVPAEGRAASLRRMLPSPGLAARAARWSARHRKTAIFGWLAFVAIAFVLGGAVGTKNIKDEDAGNGSSKVAAQAIANADFPKKAQEQVLVQSRD